MLCATFTRGTESYGYSTVSTYTSGDGWTTTGNALGTASGEAGSSLFGQFARRVELRKYGLYGIYVTGRSRRSPESTSGSLSGVATGSGSDWINTTATPKRRKSLRRARGPRPAARAGPPAAASCRLELARGSPPRRPQAARRVAAVPAIPAAAATQRRRSTMTQR